MWYASVPEPVAQIRGPSRPVPASSAKTMGPSIPALAWTTGIVNIRSLSTESVLRDLSPAMGYRLVVQGNLSSISLSNVLATGSNPIFSVLDTMGQMPRLDIVVNEPLHLLQVRILNWKPAVVASVSEQWGLPAEMKRKVMFQRGDLQSVLRQVATVTGYQIRIHPDLPFGVVGDGLPWGKAVAAGIILHKLGKQSYLDVRVPPPIVVDRRHRYFVRKAHVSDRHVS